MKIHTTNYTDTFLQVAEDSKAKKGKIPPWFRGKPTIARMQYDLLINNPYKFTSDEVLFRIHVERNNITEAQKKREWQKFFSKGQACFRASPLPKKYGWGIHFNQEGKMALTGVDTKNYKDFSSRNDLTLLQAVRSSRKG